MMSKFQTVIFRYIVLTVFMLSACASVSFGQTKDETAAKANVIFAEGRELANQGTAESMRAAMPKLEQAMQMYREISDEHNEARCLGWLGSINDSLGEKSKALDCYNQSLPLLVKVGDVGGQSRTLNNIGLVYSSLGEKSKALDYYNQALPLYIKVGDVGGQAVAINNIGLIYDDLGEKSKALDYYNQSLQLRIKVGDVGGQAVTLNNIGSVYNSLGEKSKALDYYNQALPLLIKVGDVRTQAATLNNIGFVYSLLGEKSKALDYYNQSLPLYIKVGDVGGQAATLNNIGLVYDDSGEKLKALDYYNQALSLEIKVGDVSAQAATLNNIGLIYDDLGKKSEALDCYNQSLPRWIKVGNVRGQAATLNNIGLVYSALGEKSKALDYYNQALLLEIKVGDVSGQANTLKNLMYVWWSQKNMRLAVFYGKQSVNSFQQLRQNIKGLGKETQGTYLKTVQTAYNRLAEILIAEGRIIEAEQVLDLLKQEETFNYLRRAPSDAAALQGRADLTKDEADALKRYNASADNIATLGAEFGKLQDLQIKGIALTAEQQTRFDALAKQVEDASRAFQVLLRQLADEFAKRPNTKADVQENLALQSDLKSWGDGVVFLYTLAGEDRYRVILVTPDTQTDGKSEVKGVDLDKKIADFRDIVQNPYADPRPLGKELYDILIKPIEKQLDGAKAKTLLWSLDGNLRLLPLAALWDGKQYFGQKYQNVIVTLASRTRLGDAATAAKDWRVLGLGVTQNETVTEPNGTRQINFPALANVSAELSSIVRNNETESGVMPGQRLLDDDFSQTNLQTQLQRGYKVIHIASHFSLNAGDSTKSFLLLGKNTALSVDQIKNNPQIKFNGVELLTLSACQTAVVEKDGTGKEIEGFGYVAQQKGAKAILATLWSVADDSTQLLMSEFYRLRRANPNITKAEAIQRAQTKMLEGKLTPQTADNKKRAEPVDENGKPLKDKLLKGQPPYKAEAGKPFAHPFFWSPFVLIGNWR